MAEDDKKVGMVVFNFYDYTFGLPEGVSDVINVMKFHGIEISIQAIEDLEDWLVRDGRVDTKIIQKFSNAENTRLVELICMAIAGGYTRWPLSKRIH